MYEPLNIRTLWKGTSTNYSNAGANNTLRMNTEAGYGWDQSDTQIRKEWISVAQILYEIEVNINNSKHVVWIEEDQVNIEITSNIMADKETEQHEQSEIDILENDYIGSSAPKTANFNRKLDKLLSLQIFNETDLAMNAEEAEAARKKDLKFIYEKQKAAPELQDIIEELGEPPENFDNLWQEKECNVKKKRQKRQEENSDRTTEKILITKINLNTYIGKTVIRPEGVYFWDNINGQWIMKMLRYEGKKYRKIQLGIKKENENQPVLVIPKEWGRRLAYSKHKEYNHIQANKLYALLKKDYEWKEMMLEISWIVESCQACQKTTHNLMAHGSYQAIIPRRVNDVVAIDLAVMPLSYDGYRYIMNIIDLMSRHVIAIPLKRRDQISIKNAFLKGYLCKFGRPRKLLVDQGGEFTNQLFRDLSTFAKIDVRYTQTENRQTNGVVERFNKTLNGAFRVLAVEEDEKRWTDWLDPCIYRYNLTGHNALGGESPHYVRFGYSDEDPLITLTTKAKGRLFSTTREYLETTIPELYDYWEKIAKYMEEERKKDNERKTKHCKDIHFFPGERAWLYWPNRVKRETGDVQAAFKLADTKRYLVTITAVLKEGCWYRCVTSDSNRRIEDPCHVRFLKKYVPNERPPGIEARIEDELESNKPTLEWVEHENSIGKYKAESEIIYEDIDEPERQEQKLNQMDEESLRKFIGQEFKCQLKSYRTFHIQYHPKLLSKAIWAYREKDGHQQLDQIIVMRLRTFSTRYYRREVSKTPTLNQSQQPSSKTRNLRKRKNLRNVR